MQLASEIPYLAEAEIERRAEVMLASYEERWGEIDGPPVPVERLVEVHLDLRILWKEIPEVGEHTILAYIRPSERTIVMNEAQLGHFERYLGTEVFTLGHEVGHWDLHVAKGSRQLSFGGESEREFVCRWREKDRREWQADRYAAALLMPEALVREAVAGLDLSLWRTLYRLKEAFAVSIMALRIRLEELGLIYRVEGRRIFVREEDYERSKGQLVLG